MAVIGAGVVGVAVARAAAVAGWRVVVLEQCAAVGAGVATAGNSGLGHTGYDAPVGSAERALLRRAITLHPSVMRSIGLRAEHVGGCPRGPGSLVVGWSEADLPAIQLVLAENRKAGDDSVAWITGTELQEMEPALDSKAIAAVHCPAEVVVEPFLIPVALAESAAQHGASIQLNTKVVGAIRIRADSGNRNENITVLRTCRVGNDDLGDGVSDVAARVVVNCGGIFGDHVESLRPTSAPADAGRMHPKFTVTPRKGSFALFEPPPSLKKTDLPRYIIERAPNEFSKGIIVWVNLHGHIVVGPTAEDQSSRVDREVLPMTEEALLDFGIQVIPALRHCTHIGSYSGLRPATEHRDYQLETDCESGWITVGGIRSTGLSAAVAIAEHTCQQIDAVISGRSGAAPRLPPLGISEAAGAAATNTAQQTSGTVDLEPIPSLAALRQDYQNRGDGTVSIWGRLWPVLHPQSAFGFNRR